MLFAECFFSFFFYPQVADSRLSVSAGVSRSFRKRLEKAMLVSATANVAPMSSCVSRAWGLQRLTAPVGSAADA